MQIKAALYKVNKLDVFGYLQARRHSFPYPEGIAEIIVAA
jgi:hypothetical protein